MVKPRTLPLVPGGSDRDAVVSWFSMGMDGSSAVRRATEILDRLLADAYERGKAEARATAPAGLREAIEELPTIPGTSIGPFVPLAAVLALVEASAPAGLDVERIVRLTVHTCRGRLLTAPADQESAVQAALARLAERNI